MPQFDPDSFTHCRVSEEGGRLELARWGVSLLVPAGALDPDYTEDLFLAVVGGAGPPLPPDSALLSPVVVVGPPALTLARPVVLSLGQCGGAGLAGWQAGLHHADTLGAEHWTRLVTVGEETRTRYRQINLRQESDVLRPD